MTVQSPRAVVEEFFRRMADDDERETVGELLAADAVVTLPGARFEGEDAADELLAFLEPRYAWAAKEYDRWLESGETVVSIGTLHGEANDGDPFEDVRYVDVYDVVDGRIVRLDIWNDLAVEEVVG